MNIVLLGEAAVRKDSFARVDEAERVVRVAQNHCLDGRLACPLELVDLGLEVLKRLWAGRLDIRREVDCYWLDEGACSEIIVEAVCWKRGRRRSRIVSADPAYPGKSGETDCSTASR